MTRSLIVSWITLLFLMTPLVHADDESGSELEQNYDRAIKMLEKRELGSGDKILATIRAVITRNESEHTFKNKEQIKTLYMVCIIAAQHQLVDDDGVGLDQKHTIKFLNWAFRKTSALAKVGIYNIDVPAQYVAYFERERKNNVDYEDALKVALERTSQEIKEEIRKKEKPDGDGAAEKRKPEEKPKHQGKLY